MDLAPFLTNLVPLKNHRKLNLSLLVILKRCDFLANLVSPSDVHNIVELVPKPKPEFFGGFNKVFILHKILFELEAT